MRLILILILTFFSNLASWAHKPSDSFLNIKSDSHNIAIRWDIALRDLNYLIDLDQNQDSKITGLEFKSQKQKIIDYSFSKLSLGAFAKEKAEHNHKHSHNHGHHHHHGHEHSSKTAATQLKQWIGAYCKRAEAIKLLVDEHSDGKYAVIKFNYNCKVELEKLSIDYNLLFDEDTEHRALVKIEHLNQEQNFILTDTNRHIKTQLGKLDLKKQFFNFLDQGKWHIWTGWDHILFLLVLLLPVVLAAENLKTTAWLVLKLVTSFTIAHSITLSIAALGLMDYNAGLIERLILVSIAVTAAKNLIPGSSKSPNIVLAFTFGLIHGFGFAGALKDLGVGLKALIISLLSFNIGVELGQLAIVLGFVPIAYLLRKTWFYKNLVYKLGSAIVLAISLYFCLS